MPLAFIFMVEESSRRFKRGRKKVFPLFPSPSLFFPDRVRASGKAHNAQPLVPFTWTRHTGIKLLAGKMSYYRSSSVPLSSTSYPDQALRYR